MGFSFWLLLFMRSFQSVLNVKELGHSKSGYFEKYLYSNVLRPLQVTILCFQIKRLKTIFCDHQANNELLFYLTVNLAYEHSPGISGRKIILFACPIIAVTYRGQ